MNKYRYIYNDREVAKLDFMSKLAIALGTDEYITDMISIRIANENRASLKLREAYKLIRQGFTKSWKLIVVNYGSFKIELK